MSSTLLAVEYLVFICAAEASTSTWCLYHEILSSPVSLFLCPRVSVRRRTLPLTGLVKKAQLIVSVS